MDSGHLERSWNIAGSSLAGKTVLVTGAAGHLGSSISAGLAAAGAHVLLNGRTETSLRDLERWIQSKGGTATVVPFDVSSPDGVESGALALQQVTDHLDGLVNNAYSGVAGTLESMTWASLNDAFAVNVAGPSMLVQGLLPCLRAAAEGPLQGASIVNICSMYGHVSPDPRLYAEGCNNPPEYGATKAALLEMTRYMACHLAEYGIRVNSVSPGPFPGQSAQQDARFMDRLSERNPMSRIGEPQELVGIVNLLVSGAASFMTGSDIRVDGGWTAW